MMSNNARTNLKRRINNAVAHEKSKRYYLAERADTGRNKIASVYATFYPALAYTLTLERFSTKVNDYVEIDDERTRHTYEDLDHLLDVVEHFVGG